MELFKDSINEVVLKDAYKKSSNCLSVIDVLYSSFKKGVIDEEYLSNKVRETNQRNFVYGYINGVRDAVNNDYSKEALHPSSKENTKLVNEKDFAFAFTFTDNDFGAYFEECANTYANLFYDVFKRLNMYAPMEKGELMVKSCLEDIERLESKTFLQEFFKTTFLGAYLKDSFDCYDSNNGGTYEKVMERGKYLAEEYMPFKNDDYWFIGTCAEMDAYLKENYENTFDGHTSIWNNGETLVVKIQNGVIDFQII